MDLENSRLYIEKLMNQWNDLLERIPDSVIRVFIDAVTTHSVNQAFIAILPYMSTEEMDELYQYKMEEIQVRQDSHISYSEVIAGLVKDLVGLVYIFRQELIVTAISKIAR